MWRKKVGVGPCLHLCQLLPQDRLSGLRGRVPQPLACQLLLLLVPLLKNEGLRTLHQAWIKCVHPFFCLVLMLTTHSGFPNQPLACNRLNTSGKMSLTGPAGESSMTRQSDGGTAICCATCKKQSGAGFPCLTSSPQTAACNTLQSAS